MVMVEEPATDPRQLYFLSIDEIQSDPEQPRKYFDQEALQELKDSIQKLGILQPVLVRRDEDGKIVLVAGERRLRAARELGLSDVPAIFPGGNAAEISLVENLVRADLTPIEEAEAMRQLMDRYGYSQEEIGGVLGKAQSTVSEILSLNRLPEEIKEECRKNSRCPRRILVEIAKKTRKRAMVTLYEKYKEYGLTGEEVRKETRKKAEPAQTHQAVSKMIKSLMTKLTSLDIAALSEEEKANLRGAMLDLQNSIASNLSILIT